ncbi:RNase H domain-containing protein [Trichonephila clavipes]|nr:RNase H domain-containing protein [Trichonephila clavipes]
MEGSYAGYDQMEKIRRDYLGLQQAIVFEKKNQRGRGVFFKKKNKSRSVIQHLSNWQKVGDNIGVAILKKLKHISSSHEIHLQWVPSHVKLVSNEIADSLANPQHTMNSAALTYSELHSTYINNKQSTVPPAHLWNGNKAFSTCVRCSACQASPENILDCLGLSKQDLYEDPLMVLDFLRVNGIMDLL